MIITAIVLIILATVILLIAGLLPLNTQHLKTYSVLKTIALLMLFLAFAFAGVYYIDIKKKSNESLELSKAQQSNQLTIGDSSVNLPAPDSAITNDAEAVQDAEGPVVGTEEDRASELSSGPGALARRGEDNTYVKANAVSVGAQDSDFPELELKGDEFWFQIPYDPIRFRYNIGFNTVSCEFPIFIYRERNKVRTKIDTINPSCEKKISWVQRTIAANQIQKGDFIVIPYSPSFLFNTQGNNRINLPIISIIDNKSNDPSPSLGVKINGRIP